MPGIIREIATTVFVVVVFFLFWKLSNKLENYFSLRRLILILLGVFLILIAIKQS